jgi:hypothetical protein
MKNKKTQNKKQKIIYKNSSHSRRSKRLKTNYGKRLTSEILKYVINLTKIGSISALQNFYDRRITSKKH